MAYWCLGSSFYSSYKSSKSQQQRYHQIDVSVEQYSLAEGLPTVQSDQKVTVIIQLIEWTICSDLVLDIRAKYINDFIRQAAFNASFLCGFAYPMQWLLLTWMYHENIRNYTLYLRNLAQLLHRLKLQFDFSTANLNTASVIRVRVRETIDTVHPIYDTILRAYSSLGCSCCKYEWYIMLKGKYR